MAAGYKSYAFRWFTGYAVPTASPEPGCPCPDWTVEQTLVDAFRNPNEMSTETYITEVSLVDTFTNPNEMSSTAYTNPETLINAWVRKGCG